MARRGAFTDAPPESKVDDQRRPSRAGRDAGRRGKPSRPADGSCYIDAIRPPGPSALACGADASQLAHESKGAAAAKLASIAPGDLQKVLFTLGGAESIETAMKIARMVTGRRKTVTRYRSYHGAGYGSGSAGGDPRRLPHDPGITAVVRVHDP